MMDLKTVKRLLWTPLHPEAWFFVRWGIFLSSIFFLTHFRLLSSILVLITFFIMYFFRDPFRSSPLLDGAIVSPADGTIVEITEEDSPPEELGLEPGRWKKIGIFMAPWNVHINRIPAEGTILQKAYRQGEFSALGKKETPYDNEHLSLVIGLPSGDSLVCVQIAGMMARRIVCYPEVQDGVKRGERYGLICFGSRVDLYLPFDAALLVCEGQTMVGGETLIAFTPDKKLPHIKKKEASIK